MAEKPIQYTRSGKVYVPAVTPGLRKLLIFLAVGLSLLGANSVYLASITFLSHWRGTSYENQFYLWMFLLHLALGVLLTVPFLAFAGIHIRNTLQRKNRKAIRAGYMLFASAMVILVSGYFMTLRLVPQDSVWGRAGYWVHVLSPIAAIAFYVSHRLFGPRMRWKWGIGYGVATIGFGVIMAGLHSQDPRLWNVRGGGEKYFHPSESRTATMGFIPADTLMMDEYCEKCHPDTYADFQHSMHRISSFNNEPYLFSVRETRRAMMERDGNVHGARWCAGCHDPVPFFSGAFEEPVFDEPDFDPNSHPTAKAGITCTVCHAITHVGSTIGNGDYTIEEPLHYPFAKSENGILQWVNNQLVKAKPAFHKKTFLKPLHKTADFCSTCHKVSLPKELNHYKDWLRGQNHYDPFFQSGISGHFSGAFYYPPVAFGNCSECHMPKQESDDFGNVAGKISNHRFPGSNTGVPAIQGDQSQIDFQAAFLKDKKVRVDIFGLKEGGEVSGTLSAPLRPAVPALRPGERYLVEVVVRTLAVGHTFTQGTADSNEVWLDVEAKAGDRVIGRSGALDDKGAVDPWSHFINALVLDRHGNRIDRRNPQDIFVPLYDHQIPPGAAQVVHFALRVPEDVTAPVTLTVKLNYRKFDKTYMDYVFAGKKHPTLPIVTMAQDSMTFPVGAAVADAKAPEIPVWMRWNDYGIGLLREGDKGSSKGELLQAASAFTKVAASGQAMGHVNLARVYYKEGRLEDARGALTKAVEAGSDTPWTIYWFGGLIDKENGHLDEAITKFEKVLQMRVPERKFDFSKDYGVRAELGRVLMQRGLQESGEARAAWLQRAVSRLRSVLELESEHLDAHYNLALCYGYLGDKEQEAKHRKLHAKYKPDDNARDVAVGAHRQKNPAADHAAEAIVIYDLQRQAP
jgi:hypothetical protein